MYPSDRKRASSARDELYEQRKQSCHLGRARLTPSTAAGGNGLDRYIPQVASKKAYRASPSLKKFDVREPELLERSPSPERLSSPGFFHDLRNTGHYEAITSRERQSDITLVTESSVSGIGSTTVVGGEAPDLSFEQKRHREYIADSLGFQTPQRVFQFANHASQSRANNSNQGSSALQGGHGSVASQHHHYLTVDPLTTALPPNKAMVHLATTAFSKMSQSLSFVSDDDPKRPAKRVKSHIPYRVLDAPCLRNDFYSNLVSWSRSTDNIMVGLGCSVYMWSDKHGAVPVLGHDYLNRKHDVVTCVSFCPQNLLFVVGTKQGRVLLFDQEVCLKRRRMEGESLRPLCEYQSSTLRGISCVQWLQKGKGTDLLVGEECGDVSYLSIRESLRLFEISFAGQNESESKRVQTAQRLEYGDEYQSYKLQCMSRFQAQAQQVCGLSLNEDNSLLAIGGNDNSCTLWNITSLQEPKLQFILPHNAAVKAVAFCPWSKSLLATGGGSKDRTIKFWHTTTGTLVDQIQTCGQVTSLIWSTRYKQIVATFGFGDLDDPILITLYSFPRLTPLKQVRSPTPLRVLSAVPSPNITSVCVATNDETIRFYDLWNDKEEVISDAQEGGLLGSEIMEFVEGIEGGQNKIIR